MQHLQISEREQMGVLGEAWDANMAGTVISPLVDWRLRQSVGRVRIATPAEMMACLVKYATAIGRCESLIQPEYALGQALGTVPRVSLLPPRLFCTECGAELPFEHDFPMPEAVSSCRVCETTHRIPMVWTPRDETSLCRRVCRQWCGVP